MDSSQQKALQNTFDRWHLAAPCFGANLSIDHAELGRCDLATGLSDPDTHAPMPPLAPSYVYSITKTFTAIRVLQLVEQGLCSLDDPISRYLPNPELPAAVVLRRLLNHTAGVPNYTEQPDYVPDSAAKPGEPWTTVEVLDRCCRGELDFAPGEGWHYSNTGYLLLLLLIEKLTDESYAANITRHIIEPLGLANTRVESGIDDSRLTPGYCRLHNPARRMENIVGRYHSGWCLTGLISSTTAEINRLYRALFDGELLSADSLDEMTRWVDIRQPGHPTNVKPGYGLGLMIDLEQWGGSYGHGGSGPGFNTLATHLPNFPDGALTITVFCNTSMGGHPVFLLQDLLRVLRDD